LYSFLLVIISVCDEDIQEKDAHPEFFVRGRLTLRLYIKFMSDFKNYGTKIVS
jgi:hypothetical protein